MTPDRNAIVTLTGPEWSSGPMVRGALFVYPTKDGFVWVESGYLDPYGSTSPQDHEWGGKITLQAHGFACDGKRGKAVVIGIEHADLDDEAVRWARSAFEKARGAIERQGRTLDEERDRVRESIGELFS